MDELLLAPEEIIVKIYDMAKGANSRTPYEETTVRHAPLTWPREELAKVHKHNSTLIIKGTEHPEERLPLYKPKKHRLDRPERKKKLAEILVDYGKYYASSRSIPDSANKYADQILEIIKEKE